MTGRGDGAAGDGRVQRRARLTWRGVAERLTLLLASAGMVLLLSEAFLRVFLARHYAVIYQLHPRFQYTLVPGSAKMFRRLPVNGGQVISIRVNGDGYRGDELRPRAAGRRVVLFGDSMVEAEYSATERTLARRLEGNLTTALGAPVEVVNAGVVGFGPDQVSERMEAEIPQLRPDLVIEVIFADNDFGDLIRNKMFRLDTAGRLQRNRWVLGGALRAEFAAAHRSWLLRRVGEKALLSLAPSGVPLLEDLLMDRWLARSREEYRDFVIDGSDEVTNLLDDHYDADVSLTPDSESARYKVRLMEQVLVRHRQIAEQAGVPLLLLIAPSRVDVCDDVDDGHVDRAKYPAYQREALTGAVERIAARSGVPYLNLFPPFRRSDPSRLYFRGRDSHWNDAGQDLAAELTAELVQVRGLLPR